MDLFYLAFILSTLETLRDIETPFCAYESFSKGKSPWISPPRAACTRNLAAHPRMSYVNFIILMDEMQNPDRATGRRCWCNPVRDGCAKLLSFKAGAQMWFNAFSSGSVHITLTTRVMSYHPLFLLAICKSLTLNPTPLTNLCRFQTEETFPYGNVLQSRKTVNLPLFDIGNVLYDSSWFRKERIFIGVNNFSPIR